MFRFVSDHKEPTFEVIQELLMDKTIKVSMLARQGPALERVKKELVKYWEREAMKGRTIEQYARYFLSLFLSVCLRLFQDKLLQILFKTGFSSFIFLFQVSWPPRVCRPCCQREGEKGCETFTVIPIYILYCLTVNLTNVQLFGDNFDCQEY